MGDTEREVPRTQDEPIRPLRTVGDERNRLSLQEASMWANAAKDFRSKWKDKKTVLICEPSVGEINYIAHESMCDMIAGLKEYELQSDYKFFKSSIGRLLVSYAREKFAEYALNMGFDYIMFMDDDHIWELNMFFVLEKHLKDYDIVAPLCLQRSYPHYPVIYKTEVTKMEDGRELYSNEKYVDYKEINKGDLITDADALGFGAVIINVDILKKLKRPWFFNQVGVGEDIWFSMRARKEAGARIMIDTNVEAPHLKEREPVYWQDYQRCIWEIMHGEEAVKDYREKCEVLKKEIGEKYGKKSSRSNAESNPAIEGPGIGIIKGKYCPPL